MNLTQMFMPRGGAEYQNLVQLLRTEFIKFLDKPTEVDSRSVQQL